MFNIKYKVPADGSVSLIEKMYVDLIYTLQCSLYYSYEVRTVLPTYEVRVDVRQ